VDGICNDPIVGPGQATPTGSYPDCSAGTGTFDMSGNLAEWIEDWSTDYPGNALTGGFHYYREFCDAGHDCIPINPGNPQHINRLEGAMNCLMGGGATEVFTPNQGRIYLGTRCCLEGP
jgi:formylglycine-generating enzyme required for sulfatase activity